MTQERTAGEILTTVFLWAAVVGGALYGALVIGTVWATIGGAALIGVFALVAVTVLSFAAAGVASLFKRRGSG